MTATRYLEDFPPGQAFDLGNTVVTKEEIIDFGRRFDPQPFHVDEEAAKRSAFGGLIASGWHSCGIFMRLFVDGLIRDVATLGSPGIDEIRFLKPVRPGDTLRARATVLEVVPSGSKPDRGHMKMKCELANQQGETVLTMISRSILVRRPA